MKLSSYTMPVLMLASLVSLSGCMNNAMQPSLGGGGTVATGSAAGGTSVGANEQLQRCKSPLGTLAIEEDLDGNAWWADYKRATGQRSITPTLKMIIQQSNCFQVVNRSYASQKMRSGERDFADSGEARAGSNMHKGQLKVADYSMEVSVLYSEASVGNLGGAIGGIFGNAGLGASVGGMMDQKSTAVNLNLTDVRSTQQVAAASGSSSSTAIGASLGALGNAFGGGVGGSLKTPEGQALAAAFMDAYNQMVIGLKNYNPQTDPTGMSGRGGRLAVD